MVAIIRFYDVLESKLNRLSSLLHKKKSDVIREALSYCVENIEKIKKKNLDMV